MNILNDYYCQDALSETYLFSESGVFHQLPPDADYKVRLDSVLYIFFHHTVVK